MSEGPWVPVEWSQICHRLPMFAHSPVERCSICGRLNTEEPWKKAPDRPSSWPTGLPPLTPEAASLGWIWLPVLFVAILIALVLGVILGWL